ncbi:hypothetical protein ABID62_007384 [Bradyrhizobium sp. S3.9.1]
MRVLLVWRGAYGSTIARTNSLIRKRHRCVSAGSFCVCENELRRQPYHVVLKCHPSGLFSSNRFCGIVDEDAIDPSSACRVFGTDRTSCGLSATTWEFAVKLILLLATGLAVSIAAASAQPAGSPSGRGAVNGDPAASSTTPSRDPRGTTGMSPGSSSGSGTSTSGGKDDNDQGRDKMPDSNKTVRPENQQPAKPH